MKCADIKKLLSGYLEGDLGEMENSLVSEHLKTCSSCSNELELLKETVSLLKIREPVEPPPDFIVQVRNRIEARRWWKEAVKLIFYPWHIKIPAEAIATIAIVCILYYIYHEEIPIKPAQRLEEKVPPAVVEKIEEEAPPEEAPPIVEHMEEKPAEKEIAPEILYKGPMEEKGKEAERISTAERELTYPRKAAKAIDVRMKKTFDAGYKSIEGVIPYASRAKWDEKEYGRLVTEEAAEGKIPVEQLELSITLKRPKKDSVKIKKYLSLLNAEEISESYNEETREKIICIRIKKKNYFMLVEKLIQMDAIKPQEVKEPLGEDVMVKLRIR